MSSILIAFGGGLVGIVVICVLAAMYFRTVVETNEVHIVQSARKTQSFGKDTGNGNVYYNFPGWVPILGVSKIILPVSVFSIKIEAYEAYDVNEELALNLQGSAAEREARGVPEAADLLADLQEAEKCLERFADVADAVASGRPIPKQENEAEITIRGKDAKRVCDLLEKIAYFHGSGPWNNEEKAFAKMIGDELRNKIKEG